MEAAARAGRRIAVAALAALAAGGVRVDGQTVVATSASRRDRHRPDGEAEPLRLALVRRQVSGRNISHVVFTRDGNKRKTVRAAPRRTVFSVRVNPRAQSYRAHRLSAAGTFRASATTRTRALRYVYPRCAHAAPKLTG